MCLCNPEIRTPWCDGCKSFAYQRIKELECTVLDLQSELSRKKMSLTVACNRVEELEDKLKIAVEVLVKISNTPSGDSRFNTRTEAAIVLEKIGELK